MWWIMYVAGKETVNVLNATSIQGELNLKFLEKSLFILLKNTEMLRTSISPWRPVQKIHKMKKSMVCLETFDFSQSGDKKEILTREKVIKILKTRFPLSNPPLVRFLLIQTEADNYFFFIIAPHIAVDHKALLAIEKQVFESYQTLDRDQGKSLTKEKIQISDMLEWEKLVYQKDYLIPHREFWKKNLSDISPSYFSEKNVLEKSDFQSYMRNIKFKKNQVNELEKIANQSQASLQIAWLAILGIFIYLNTGNKKFCIINALDKRIIPGTESLVTSLVEGMPVLVFRPKSFFT